MMKMMMMRLIWAKDGDKIWWWCMNKMDLTKLKSQMKIIKTRSNWGKKKTNQIEEMN